MLFKQLVALLLTLFLFIYPQSAQAADYPPPLSYSNAQLSRKDFSGQQLQVAEFSNANLYQANFANANLRGAVLSTSVLTKANLHGADLTNAMVDQINFDGADLSDAILVESILLRSVFPNVNINGADFSDALLDGAQIKELCAQASGVNSHTGVATRDSLGCR